MKVVKTRHGARIVQDGLILSEIRSTPGPTDSLFDVLAACIGGLSPGARTAILGFAGGGVIAPLRACGFGHPIQAVDLSLEGERLFRTLAGPWAGDVQVHEEDALRWLRRQRRSWDTILEDLSVQTSLGVTKPAVSLEELPALMSRRVSPSGMAITNVLPVPGLSWRVLLDRLAAPWPHAVVVHLVEYENRVLIASHGALDARRIRRDLSGHLDAIGSDQASLLFVRSLP